MAKRPPQKTALETSRLKVAGPTVGTLIYILFGPIVWAVHLTIIYGFQSAGCALTGYSAGFSFYGALGIALVTAIAALKLLAAALWPSLIERGLGASTWGGELHAGNRTIMRWLAGLSIFAVLASGLAVFIIPVCASLR